MTAVIHVGERGFSRSQLAIVQGLTWTLKHLHELSVVAAQQA